VFEEGKRKEEYQKQTREQRNEHQKVYRGPNQKKTVEKSSMARRAEDRGTKIKLGRSREFYKKGGRVAIKTWVAD